MTTRVRLVEHVVIATASLLLVATTVATDEQTSPRRLLQDPSGQPDAEANDPQARGATKVTSIPDVGGTQQLGDPTSRGYNPGVQIQNPNSIIVGGAYKGPERDFAYQLNYPQPGSGNAQPYVTVNAQQGASTFGPGYYPYGTVPVSWVWAGIYVVPRYVAGGWLAALTGFGAQQTATIVFDYFTVKLPTWPGSPTFWSYPVGWTYAWPYWRYQAYSNYYGNPYFKTDPQVITLNDQYGNKLIVTGRTTINTQTWEVVNFRADTYEFIPLGPNQGSSGQASVNCGAFPNPTYGYNYKCCRWCSQDWCSPGYKYSWTTDYEASKGTYACEGGDTMSWGSCNQTPPNDGQTYRCCTKTTGNKYFSWITTYQIAQAPYSWTCAGA
eukprot:jgi/Botrbrau1/21963/Bobra.0249s0086.1